MRRGPRHAPHTSLVCGARMCDLVGLSVDGLALDGHVLSLGDGFTVTGCDDPVSVENGVIEVLDLDTLDDAELQEIVGQIDTLLGDLLGEGGADVLNVDHLLDGDLGFAFDDLLGGLL